MASQVAQPIFVFYNVSVCFEIPPGFVRIEAGTFTMGSPESELGQYSDEENHQVTLTHGFYMSDHEVTQAEWKALIGNNPSGLNRDACDTCPVDSVNWWEALYYANSLSNLEELTRVMSLRAAAVQPVKTSSASV